MSILHRITGVILFLALPPALYLLEHSLTHQAGFEEVSAMIGRPAGRLLVLLTFASLALHIFAGIRHLALDVHCGVAKKAARQSAIWVIVAALLVLLLAGWSLFL